MKKNYNPNRSIKTSRRTGTILKNNVNYNEYDGVKSIRPGNGEMIDGFRIKPNHVAMFDDKGMLIKVATSIVTKPNKQFIIVFIRGKFEWLKNNYSIDRFIEDFGEEYLSILPGAKDIYAKDSKAKEIHEEMINQVDFVSSHLFEIYSGRTEELVYLLDTVKRYNEQICVRIMIPDEIKEWDATKTFDLDNNTVTGGLTLHEDTEIEIEFMRRNGVENYLSYREQIEDLAYDNFMNTILPFIGYIKSGKWNDMERLG